MTLEKTETLTDWSRRPLTPAQLSYAADDVRYLLSLYEGLRLRLTGLDRWEWLRQECRMLTRSTLACPPNQKMRISESVDEDRYGRKGLPCFGSSPPGVRKWLASATNRDRVLLVTRRWSRSHGRRRRRLQLYEDSARCLRELERHADDVVCRVARALEGPKELWPQPPADAGESARRYVELLQAALRTRG